MNTNSASIQVLVNGKTIKQYLHQGSTYIEAKEGSEYSIKIKNEQLGRKLAVITVDGVNVISGKPHVEGDTQGYIIDGFASIDIKGFRKDLDSVGAFKFCNKGKSYCNEKGLKGNNGVIGVKLYREHFNAWVTYATTYNQPLSCGSSRDYTWIPAQPLTNCGMSNSSESVYRSCNYSSAVVASSSSSSVAPSFELGTTWGSKVSDSVTYSSFNIDESSVETFQIFYDTRKNLEKIGIDTKVKKEVFFPKAFDTFATPPKGWKE